MCTLSLTNEWAQVRSPPATSKMIASTSPPVAINASNVLRRIVVSFRRWSPVGLRLQPMSRLERVETWRQRSLAARRESPRFGTFGPAPVGRLRDNRDMDQIRVFLLDDHEVVRRGVR